MFQMTVHADTLAELSARLMAAADALGNGSDAPSATAASTTAGSATAARTSSQGRKGSTPSDTSSQQSGGSPEADDELTYEKDVQPLVAKLGTTHGKQAARDVLANFEDEAGETCTKATQVAEAEWPELIKKVKAAQRKLDKEKAAAEADD